jgi:hypothetical protein
VSTVAQVPGGVTLAGHLANPDTADTLHDRPFNVVVLQEQSQIPASAELAETMMTPAATQLATNVRRAGPGRSRCCSKRGDIATGGRRPVRDHLRSQYAGPELSRRSPRTGRRTAAGDRLVGHALTNQLDGWLCYLRRIGEEAVA